MFPINLFSSNKDRVVLLTFVVLLFVCVTFIIPVIFINYIPESIIGSYFILNLELIFLSMGLFLYFLYIGIYIYKIQIDPYVINISSYRILTSLFAQKDYVDISHLMLKEYAFFNRSFTWSRTLMLKIKTDNNRIVSKRFMISLISKKEEKRISKILDQILSNNRK